MKQVEKLHQLYNLFPQHNKFHLSYQYDIKKHEWKFIGWKCIRCNIIFKKPDTVPNHEDSCNRNSKPRKPRKRDRLTEETVIRNSQGEITFWEPLDFNQIFSVTKK